MTQEQAEPPPEQPAADEPETQKPPEEESAGIMGWILFGLITILCFLAAYIQLTGIKQLPLP